MSDLHVGVVTSFDERAGLGTVTIDGGATIPFHCTELADGTRSTTVGARMRFGVAFRVLRLEAVDVGPC